MVASEQHILSEAIEKYYSSEVSFDEVMMDFDMDDEDVDFDEEFEEDTNVLDLEKFAGEAFCCEVGKL